MYTEVQYINLLAALDFIADVTNDLTPVMPSLAAVLQASIDLNFALGGRYGTDNEFGGGSTKWKISLRAKEDKGKTGIDTGVLKNAQSVFVVGNRIQIGGTFPDYNINFHFGSPKRNNPARPVYVIQNADFDEMAEILNEYIRDTLERVVP